mmetsp:Transcript_24877/g.69832  ORF Transcript_24877/g.69832 Transcript_24877/m.69832 type:complete len:290 (+) Transcript_24877:939-1808(+)
MSQFIGRDSHAEKALVVDWALAQVERARDDKEPLRIIVNDKIHDVRESNGRSRERHQLMRRDDGDVLRVRQQQRLQMRRRLRRNAQRVRIARFHGRPPHFFNRPAHFRRETREFGVQFVDGLDQVGLLGLDVEHVVEDGGVPLRQGPGAGGIRQPMMPEPHADRGNHDGRLALAALWQEFRQRRGLFAVLGDVAGDVKPFEVGGLRAFDGNHLGAGLSPAQAEAMRRGNLEGARRVCDLSDKAVDVALRARGILDGLVGRLAPLLQRRLGDEDGGEGSAHHQGGDFRVD